MDRKLIVAEKPTLLFPSRMMILRETFPTRGRFLNQVGIVNSLRAEQSHLQKSVVPNTLSSAVAFDQVGVHRRYLGDGQEVRCSASFL